MEILPNSEQEELFDKINILLYKCRFDTTQKHIDEIEKVIEYMKEYIDKYKKLFYPTGGCIRGLVGYPQYLLQFLNMIDKDIIFSKPFQNDLSCMMCRIIEKHLDRQTFDIILNFTKKFDINLELLLLHKKYNINTEYYKLCNAKDIYYEKSTRYDRFNYMKLEEDNGYYGYRDVYHMLQYTPLQTALKYLEQMWEETPVDCTFDAVCDYFHIKIEKDNKSKSELVNELIMKIKNEFILK